MNSLLPNVRTILESAGYRTFQPLPASTALYFEDACVLGVVYAVPTVMELVARWEQLQDGFLKDNSRRLVQDPTKAWNSYTVLLTTEPASADDASALAMIEEDFRGTRKLARSGVITRINCEEALAPLLPLRRLIGLMQDSAAGRLESRLAGLGSPLRTLLTDAEPTKIATELLGLE